MLQRVREQKGIGKSVQENKRGNRNMEERKGKVKDKDRGKN